MSKTVKGTLFTVVAGIAWGLSGTSGQYLMAHGISALVLTNLRLIIAGLALVFLTYATAKDKLYAFLKDRKSLFSLLLFALFGLFFKPVCLSFCHSGNQCWNGDGSPVCLSRWDLDLYVYQGQGSTDSG